MTRFLHHAAFFVGLAAVCWVGVGYIGTNPLALAITVLIGAFYLMGALELHRFHQATSTLARAVADMPNPPPTVANRWPDDRATARSIPKPDARCCRECCGRPN